MSARALVRSLALAALASTSAGCSLVFPMDDYDRGTSGPGGNGTGGHGAGGTSGAGGGGGAPAACGEQPPVSEIVDTFDTGLSASMALFGPCIAVTNGEVVATPTVESGFCWAYTLGSHRLACDSFSVRAGPTLTPGLGAQTFIYVEDLGGGGDLNLILEGGSFQFVPALPLVDATYDPTRDNYWRLEGGVPGPNGETTLTFYTSEDGASWDERGGGVSPIPLTNVTISIGAGVYQDPGVATGEAHFDCVNVAGACP